MCVCIYIYIHIKLGFPGSTRGKEPTCQSRRCKRYVFDPWVGKILWRKTWQPTPVFFPRESHGQRNLLGYSPCCCRVGHDWSDSAHKYKTESLRCTPETNTTLLINCVQYKIKIKNTNSCSCGQVSLLIYHPWLPIAWRTKWENHGIRVKSLSGGCLSQPSLILK